MLKLQMVLAATVQIGICAALYHTGGWAGSGLATVVLYFLGAAAMAPLVLGSVAVSEYLQDRALREDGEKGE